MGISIIVLRVGGATILFKNLYINSIPAFADLLAYMTGRVDYGKPGAPQEDGLAHVGREEISMLTE
ncbi:hypothetical protein N2601_31970 (plasmid) [Rhizobium sp. CB3060]|uniref:hypothetical protein n=1 Tax=Rhizobium sp. CB3060 TaxID=3138255 RepID=UPI0021A704F4|nr:hypothetical protein [Rhizobium tropici]UWU25582.1 hypothetical protein N2601_31970 [Rhizobium tropici]